MVSGAALMRLIFCLHLAQKFTVLDVTLSNTECISHSELGMVAALSSSCRPNTTIRLLTLAYTNLSPQVIGSKQHNALRGQFRYRCLRFTPAWLLIDKKRFSPIMIV